MRNLHISTRHRQAKLTRQPHAIKKPLKRASQGKGETFKEAIGPSFEHVQSLQHKRFRFNAILRKKNLFVFKQKDFFDQKHSKQL